MHSNTLSLNSRSALKGLETLLNKLPKRVSRAQGAYTHTARLKHHRMNGRLKEILAKMRTVRQSRAVQKSTGACA